MNKNVYKMKIMRFNYPFERINTKRKCGELNYYYIERKFYTPGRIEYIEHLTGDVI